jgi:DNA-binding Lrp family transcriptional regulator
MCDKLTEEERKILARLYESRYGMFANEDVPVSLRLIAVALSIEVEEAGEFVARLLEKGLVKKITVGDTPFYEITLRGAEEYEYAAK